MLCQTCITLPLLYNINKLISYITKFCYHESQPQKRDFDIDLDFEHQLWMSQGWH